MKPIFGGDCVAILASICLVWFLSEKAHAAPSDWVSQPKPSFPAAALEKNSEGAVRLRLVLTKEGTVDHVVVVRKSGDRELDEAAKRGVLTWKMKRGAIKPADLIQGREVLIDFREEAAIAAVYPGRVFAAFANVNGAYKWRSAPFPSYPMDARIRHEEGIVRLKVTIGKNGNVAQVGILQSSGHKALDDAAVSAVQRWKAHPQYAGQTVALPVLFTMSRVLTRADVRR